jgi:cytochrome P450
MPAPLPPGSLSLLNSLRALRQRNFYRDEAAKYGPIFKMAQFHKKVACLTDLATSQRLLREHGDSLGSAIQVFNQDITGSFLRYMNDDLHKYYGPLFARALAKPIVNLSIPCAHQVMRQSLPELNATVELEPFLLKATRAVFTRVLFGIEPGTPEAESFRNTFAAIAKRHVNQRLTADGVQALRQLRDRVRTLTMQSCSLAEIARHQNGAPDDTAIDNLLFILRISANDAAGLMVWIIEFLGLHPEWLDRVRAGGAPDLPLRIIKETVRLSRSEYLYRIVEKEFEFDGFRFPAGWMVRICVAEGHRDPRYFPDPDTFNPDRFLANPPSDSQYSPFGIRDHSCKGVDLAIMLATALIEELTAYDITLTGSGRTRPRDRHWKHWMPLSKVTLRRR